MVLTTRRTSEVGDPACYEVTLEDGRSFQLKKEFYADGPSLYTWVLTADDFWQEFATKRAAVRFLGESV